ncbi:MAG TPA: hypothetical protein VNJ28_01065 [Candidatus Limnocylindrales bacterium]|nr:hypothetical protein [Candidatus Limnocylindrales bacterium]
MDRVAPRPHEGCACGATDLLVERFDITFRLPDGDERDVFGLRATYCPSCGRLTVPAGDLALLGLGQAEIVSAIASDAREAA